MLELGRLDEVKWNMLRYIWIKHDTINNRNSLNHLNYYPKICICTIYMNISNSHSLYFRLCPLPFYSSFTRLLRKIDDWHSFNTYLFNRQVTKEHILVVTANQQKMNDVYRQLFYFLILKVLSKGRYKKYCMRQYFFENMDMDSTWS